MISKDSKDFSQEKENVLDILNTAIKAIKKGDYLILKDLSNRTIHSASIYQDSDSISTAVTIYSLSKVLERSKYSEYKDWPVFSKTCLKALVKGRDNFKNDRIEEFSKNLKEINSAINRLEGNLKKYIEEVFRKAMINKASRIYEHGISMQKTAELLGISEWELSEYAGKTGISDVDLSITLDVRIRVQKAMELFR